MTVLAGAVISLVLFLIASWDSPLLLKFLIGAWVVAPFIGAAAVRGIMPRTARATDRAMLGATLLSVAVYSFSILAEPGWKPAAPFVAVPAFIWILVVAAALIGR